MVRSVQLSLLVALVAGSGSSFAANIQQVGHRKSSCSAEGCDGCNSNACSQSGDYCDTGGRQRCGLRGTWRDFGTNWTGRCGPIGRAARLGIPGARCLKYCMDTKGSGDSGWAPPARMPVNRTNTGFGSYTNYGGGAYGGAPMVYQPTDTAQLGYTYAHVPTWKRNPSMIPPTPNPSMFHARFCPRDPRGGMCMDAGAGCMMNGGYGDCMGGQVIEGPMMGGDYCPACVSDARPTATALPTPRAGEGVFRMAQLRQSPNNQKPATVKMQPNIRLAAQQTPVQPVQVKSVQVPQPQLQIPSPQVQLPQPKMTQPQAQNNLPVMQQPTRQSQPQQRRTAGRRQTAKPKKSGGWFGLPSLNDVKF